MPERRKSEIARNGRGASVPVSLACIAPREGIPNTQMAAKGGYRELSDTDIKTLVDYMIAAAALPPTI
ncbi:MAG: hypothetical protein ACXWIS_25865 [Burkholderiales bacterium]